MWTGSSRGISRSIFRSTAANHVRLGRQPLRPPGPRHQDPAFGLGAGRQGRPIDALRLPRLPSTGPRRTVLLDDANAAARIMLRVVVVTRIAILGAALAAGNPASRRPSSAMSLQPRVRVAVTSGSSGATLASPTVTRFFQELQRRLGYVDGVNLTIEYRERGRPACSAARHGAGACSPEA